MLLSAGQSRVIDVIYSGALADALDLAEGAVAAGKTEKR